MPGDGTWSTVWDPAATWQWCPVRTRWLLPGDDLAAVLDGCTPASGAAPTRWR